MKPEIPTCYHCGLPCANGVIEWQDTELDGSYAETLTFCSEACRNGETNQ